jgi:hypothetical protein
LGCFSVCKESKKEGLKEERCDGQCGFLPGRFGGLGRHHTGE